MRRPVYADFELRTAIFALLQDDAKLGYPRIAPMLRAAGYKVGRKRLEGIIAHVKRDIGLSIGHENGEDDRFSELLKLRPDLAVVFQRRLRELEGRVRAELEEKIESLETQREVAQEHFQQLAAVVRRYQGANVLGDGHLALGEMKIRVQELEVERDNALESLNRIRDSCRCGGANLIDNRRARKSQS